METWINVVHVFAVTYARKLISVAHIGPPKTATTSLQNAVIPKFLRPSLVKPDWTRSLARDESFLPPKDLPADLVVSDEILGEFAAFPPDVIATRLATVFDQAIILYVERDPLDLFYSYFRQRLLNSVRICASLTAKRGQKFFPADANQFYDEQLAAFRAKGCGFFAMIRFKANRGVFQKRFRVEALPFSALNKSPNAFVEAFSHICGERSPHIEMPRANKTDLALMPAALERATPSLPDDVRDAFIHLYANTGLTADREDFIRSWPATQGLEAFVGAFQIRKS